MGLAAREANARRIATLCSLCQYTWCPGQGSVLRVQTGTMGLPIAVDRRLGSLAATSRSAPGILLQQSVPSYSSPYT